MRSDRIPHLWPHTVGFGWGTEVEPGVVCARKFESLGQRDDACLAALGTTVDVHESVGVDRIEARMYELARALKTGLRDAGISMATPDAPELSAGVCLVEVPMARRREVLGRLEREHGIAGSPAGGLRLCPHFYNTMEHVERTVAGVVALRDLLA